MRAALLRVLFARRVHRTPHRIRDQLLTSANVLTIARGIVTSAVMLAAIVNRSPALLLGGLLLSWLLDIADGQLARWRKCESVLGAQLDILADRAAGMWVVLGVVVFEQASLLSVCAGAAVWVQLNFFDQLLAGQFLRFGLWTPDEFHLAEPRVWRLNWAPASKMVGNLPLALLALRGPFLWIALVLALVLASIRVVSYLRITQRTGMEGFYDPLTDEATFLLDGCGEPTHGDSDAIGRVLDTEGRVIALRYQEASKQLPTGLLQFLMPFEAGLTAAPVPANQDISPAKIEPIPVDSAHTDDPAASLEAA
jgi:phosphatidylglycerophosphate synthase